MASILRTFDVTSGNLCSEELSKCPTTVAKHDSFDRIGCLRFKAGDEIILVADGDWRKFNHANVLRAGQILTTYRGVEAVVGANNGRGGSSILFRRAGTQEYACHYPNILFSEQLANRSAESLQRTIDTVLNISEFVSEAK